MWIALIGSVIWTQSWWLDVYKLIGIFAFRIVSLIYVWLDNTLHEAFCNNNRRFTHTTHKVCYIFKHFFKKCPIISINIVTLKCNFYFIAYTLQGIHYMRLLVFLDWMKYFIFFHLTITPIYPIVHVFIWMPIIIVTISHYMLLWSKIMWFIELCGLNYIVEFILAFSWKYKYN